jgi:3-oxoacyl-[acyl-carrier protein] reductase
VSNLENRVALVTGASRGIGKAIALALAKAGCNVVVNYRNDPESAHVVVKEVRSKGRTSIAVKADLSSPSEVGRLVAEAEHAFGEIHILVNTAGVAEPKPLADLDLRDWDNTLRVNLTAAFLLTQQVLVNMRPKRWGRIISISSVAAQNGGVIGPHYAASNAGLIGLTRSYALLLAKEGITVNAIAPAFIEPDTITASPNATGIPMGKFGSPDEIGRLAVFLSQSDYITGQTISVNGGVYTM